MAKDRAMTGTAAEIVRHPDSTYEHDGLLWRAKPGATSTFEERVRAAEFFIDLHADEFWNPWRMEEEAAELESAHAVMDEWERAEPGFRPMTAAEFRAESDREDHDWDKWRDDYAKRLEGNKQRYDPERQKARLELLEVRSRLAHQLAEVTALRSGEAYPAMDSQRRGQQVAELEEHIRRDQAAVERLNPIVGDPEDVTDQHGQLPADRRPTMLYCYREWRIETVKRLRTEIAELDAGIAAAGDKAERSRLRTARQITKCQLDEHLAVPRMEADDMCADCPQPLVHHALGGAFTGGPCPAWPDWGARLRKVRQMLENAAQHPQQADAARDAPKPKPLAVVSSGLPIAEIVKRLQELQEQFPDAQVRRGRANRWELWAKENEKQ